MGIAVFLSSRKACEFQDHEWKPSRGPKTMAKHKGEEGTDTYKCTMHERCWGGHWCSQGKPNKLMRRAQQGMSAIPLEECSACTAVPVEVWGLLTADTQSLAAQVLARPCLDGPRARYGSLVLSRRHARRSTIDSFVLISRRSARLLTWWLVQGLPTQPDDFRRCHRRKQLLTTSLFDLLLKLRRR